jgi:tetratricopeptide (TPR) repeat protein
MESLFAGRLDEVSASLAVHFDRGGQPAQAVPFLERAAAVAARVSANEEAIRCLNYALSLLETLPPTRERDDRELSIRSSLSVALNSARGYASLEVEQNLDRVFALARADGQGHLPVRWLWVAFTHRFMLGDLKGTREAAEHALASSLGDPSCLCEAHHAMGGMLMSVGELAASQEHFEASLAAYDEAHPQRSALGSDLGVFAHAWYSHALWLLGEEDLAVTHADQGISLARRLDHHFSQAIALAYAALLHQFRHDSGRVLEYAGGVVQLCERYGFAYYRDWAAVLLGWVHGQDAPEQGIQTIESALIGLDAQRAQARRPYYLSLLADTYRLAGQPDRAVSIVNTAIEMARARGDAWWLPALLVQKSELSPAAERDLALRTGLEFAQAHHSLSLVRRITSALSAAT